MLVEFIRNITLLAHCTDSPLRANLLLGNQHLLLGEVPVPQFRMNVSYMSLEVPLRGIDQALTDRTVPLLHLLKLEVLLPGTRVLVLDVVPQGRLGDFLVADKAVDPDRLLRAVVRKPPFGVHGLHMIVKVSDGAKSEVALPASGVQLRELVGVVRRQVLLLQSHGIKLLWAIGAAENLVSGFFRGFQTLDLFLRRLFPFARR